MSWTRSRARCGALAAIAGASLLGLTACDRPAALDQPSTRALERGAVASLTSTKGFEVIGSYAEAGHAQWIDLQLARPNAEHVIVNGANQKLEAIILGNDAYFRGQQFLSQHMGSDPLSRNLVLAAGNAWWKGAAGHVPQLPHLVDGSSFQSTFLGPSVSQRTDHVSVDGIDAVDLSGPRAHVYIAATPPYRLLGVHLNHGVVVDGISDAHLGFFDFGRDFRIAAPSDVIDFSHLSTLPPIYTLVSVDTSHCGSSCTVSALLKNLGGLSGARALSTVTFTMTDAASGRDVGSCQALVQPDVGYNATTTVTCGIGDVTGQQGRLIVTAAAYNPGRV